MDDEGVLPEGVVPIPFSEVGPNDVLCGRGGSINTHVGNERYRQIVDSKKRIYLTARFKREKRLIASSIVDEIHALDPPGRFLTKIRAPKGEEDLTTNKRNKKGTKVADLGWYEVEDEKARDKTSQALRENAPEIRKEMEVERKQYMMERQQKMQDDYDDYDEFFDEGEVSYHSPQQRRHHHTQHPSSHYHPSSYGSWMPHFSESQVSHSWHSFKNAASTAVTNFMPYGAPVSSNHVTPEVGRNVVPPGHGVYAGGMPNGTRLSFDEQERVSKSWAPYTKSADPPFKPSPRYPTHPGQPPYQQHPPMMHNQNSSHKPLPPMSPMEQTPVASTIAYDRSDNPHGNNHPNMSPPPTMMHRAFENAPPPPPPSSLLHNEQDRARTQQEDSISWSSPEPRTQQEDSISWSSPERRQSSPSPPHVTPDQQMRGLVKEPLQGQKRKAIQTDDTDPAMQGGRHNKPALSVRSADFVAALDKEESWEHTLGINSLLDEMEVDESMGLGSGDLADPSPRVGETVTTTMVHDARDDMSDSHGGAMGMCGGLLPDTTWLLSCAFGMNRGTSVGNSIGTMDDSDSLASPLGGASLCNVFDFEDHAPSKPTPLAHGGRQKSVRSSIQDSEIVVRHSGGTGITNRRSTVSPLTLQRDRSDRSFRSNRGGTARRSFENLMQPSPINAQTNAKSEDVVMGDFAASWARGSLGSE